MADAGSCGMGGGRIGDSNSPPHPPPPVFRSEAGRRKWNRSEGARKWMNWVLLPPGKLARYANSGKGSSSDASGRTLAPPFDDSCEEEEEAPRRTIFNSRDYVLNDDEEVTAIQQVTVISEAEARARFLREEADAIRQVHAYKAVRREATVHRVKNEVVDLDAE
ncbi:hypothetical protein QYE76_040123 [Lolium multiflorum]|uniref:Uncharacterized protein n=1 Tax=Lolium multiflorum TaxID=4521 RepID=A0AAD8WST2_LOLMU|nr:hypothetical protein QYE76_040123 [Lolium multiflorum]